MTAQPIEPGLGGAPHEVIHLDGEPAAVVPLPELRRLQALRRHATPQELDEAEAEAAREELDEWEVAGRPGAVSHAQAMRELLSGEW